LHKLHARNPNMWFCLSARSHVEPDFLSNANVFRIPPLARAEVMELVRTYASCQDADAIDRVYDDLPRDIQRLLTTPLMVLLFIIHFTVKNTIPDTLIAFYKDLPDLLINRHNQLRGKEKRPISSGLKSDQLRKFFGAVCYFMMDRHPNEDLLAYDLEELASRALKSLNYSVSARAALDDIIAITNLIVRSGRYYRIAHRTIMEYYAAAFIAFDCPFNGTFYERMLTQWNHWYGVIQVLEVIDRARCIEKFLLPDLVRLSPFTYESYLSSHSTLELRFPDSLSPLGSKLIRATLVNVSSYALATRVGIGAVISWPMLARYAPAASLETIREKLLSGQIVRIRRRASRSGEVATRRYLSPWLRYLPPECPNERAKHLYDALRNEARYLD
jgi:hypothetical protein